MRVIIDDVVEWDQKANGLITVKDPTGEYSHNYTSRVATKPSITLVL